MKHSSGFWKTETHTWTTYCWITYHQIPLAINLRWIRGSESAKPATKMTNLPAKPQTSRASAGRKEWSKSMAVITSGTGSLSVHDSWRSQPERNYVDGPSPGGLDRIALVSPDTCVKGNCHEHLRRVRGARSTDRGFDTFPDGFFEPHLTWPTDTLVGLICLAAYAREFMSLCRWGLTVMAWFSFWLHVLWFNAGCLWPTFLANFIWYVVQQYVVQSIVTSVAAPGTT